jgi:hypothetical protein
MSLPAILPCQYNERAEDASSTLPSVISLIRSLVFRSRCPMNRYGQYIGRYVRSAGGGGIPQRPADRVNERLRRHRSRRVGRTLQPGNTGRRFRPACAAVQDQAGRVYPPLLVPPPASKSAKLDEALWRGHPFFRPEVAHRGTVRSPLPSAKLLREQFSNAVATASRACRMTL